MDIACHNIKQGVGDTYFTVIEQFIGWMIAVPMSSISVIYNKFRTEGKK